jgi:hypothetical protein
MKTNGLVSRRILGVVVLLLGVGFGTGIESACAQTNYSVGESVTNFTLYLRRSWTNEAGRGFPAGASLRLSDFAGSIVFFEFFDPT